MLTGNESEEEIFDLLHTKYSRHRVIHGHIDLLEDTTKIWLAVMMDACHERMQPFFQPANQVYPILSPSIHLTKHIFSLLHDSGAIDIYYSPDNFHISNYVRNHYHKLDIGYIPKSFNAVYQPSHLYFTMGWYCPALRDFSEIEQFKTELIGLLNDPGAFPRVWRTITTYEALMYFYELIGENFSFTKPAVEDEFNLIGTFSSYLKAVSLNELIEIFERILDRHPKRDKEHNKTYIQRIERPIEQEVQLYILNPHRPRTMKSKKIGNNLLAKSFRKLFFGKDDSAYYGYIPNLK